MKINEIRCDLCRNPAKEAALLLVPKDWTSEGRPKVVEPEMLGMIFLAQPSRMTEFDICRNCTEALLRSQLWLRGVMERAGR